MIDDDTKLPVDDQWVHIFPQEDTFKHELVGTECWCNPDIDYDDMLIIHRCEHERYIDGITFH